MHKLPVFLEERGRGAERERERERKRESVSGRILTFPIYPACNSEMQRL
jgi:hypothetical protein